MTKTSTLAIMGMGIYVLYKLFGVGDEALNNISEFVVKEQVTAEEGLASNLGIVTSDLQGRANEVKEQRDKMINENLEHLERAGYDDYVRREGSKNNIESYDTYWKEHSSDVARLLVTARGSAYEKMPITSMEHSIIQAEANKQAVKEAWTEEVPRAISFETASPSRIIASQGRMSTIGQTNFINDLSGCVVC